MNLENQVVIDVEVEQIDTQSRESIERWYSTAQVQRILGLNKSALQKAIAKLQGIYGIDIKTLRRGGARATEYSQIALDAIELLNAQKFTELRHLVEKTPAASRASQPGTLTIAEYTPALDRRITQLSQNAASTSASLNQSVLQLLEQIATENQASQQRDSDLDNAEINAAQNRGAARALAVFQADKKPKMKCWLNCGR
jgi:hypothetical protein